MKRPRRRRSRLRSPDVARATWIRARARVARRRRERGPLRAGRIGPRAVVWAAMLAIATSACGLVVDLPTLLLDHTRLRAICATGAVGIALAVLLAIGTSPLIAALAAVARRLYRRGGIPRALAPLPLAAAAWTCAEALSQPYPEESQFPSTVLKGIFTLGVGLVAAGGLRRPSRSARLVAFGLLAIGIATDLTVAKTLYRELHDLAALTAIAGALALLRPLRARLRRLPPRRLGLALAAAAALSFGVIYTVDAAAPGWRAQAWQHARAQSRLARAARGLVDTDFDGFSPIAWGGDCNDFDDHIGPLAHDRPGGPDHNCNGTFPAKAPRDDERGLAPPFGDPNYPPGTVDRVLLITIDCMRVDALSPEVTPNLTRLARDGITFTRFYSGGASTIRSLPLIQRGIYNGRPVADRLAARGVQTSLVFPFRSTELRPIISPGFHAVYAPEKPQFRWNASDTTDLALAEINAHPRGRHYLWLHYFDAHQPYEPPPDPAPGPFAPFPALDPASATYLGEVAYIDREIGRLLRGMEEKGLLGRTLLVVTADHGEGFGQHGVPLHAVSGYEPLVHVPGILVGPGILPGRYEELASHRDISLTVLGAFGMVEGDAEWMGRSLLRLRGGERRPLHRFTVSYSARSARGEVLFQEMAALVEGRRKLIQTFDDGLLELYDPVGDPAEREDLIPAEPAETRRLWRELAMWRDLDKFP